MLFYPLSSGNWRATNNTEMVILDEIFERSKINEFRFEDLAQAEVFSEEQKTAFIKAVLYVVSVDNIITEEEKIFLSQLCFKLGVTNDFIMKAEALSDENMFDLLSSTSDEQEAYIIACLNSAANVDQSLDNKEENLIEIFTKHMQSGKRPTEFYNKILTF